MKWCLRVWLDVVLCANWHIPAQYHCVICLTWLYIMCSMTHSFVWHDSATCVTWIHSIAAWYIHVCDVTLSYLVRIYIFMCTLLPNFCSSHIFIYTASSLSQKGKNYTCVSYEYEYQCVSYAFKYTRANSDRISLEPSFYADRFRSVQQQKNHICMPYMYTNIRVMYM